MRGGFMPDFLFCMQSPCIAMATLVEISKLRLKHAYVNIILILIW